MLSVPAKSQLSDENRPSYFDPLSKSIVLCVLRDLLDELDILKKITDTYEMKLIRAKNKEEKDESPEMVDLKDFQKDFDFIETTIKVTFDEIRTTGRYQELLKLVEGFRKNQNDDVRLIEDTKNKEIEYLKLQSLVNKERENLKQSIDECMANIGMIKDEIEDFQIQGQIKSQYIQQWETARTEINKYTLTQREDILTETIGRNQLDFTKEDRVHMEIANIYTELDNDLQKEVGKWMRKYDEDYGIIQQKIDALTEKRDQQRAKSDSLKKLFKKRAEEIGAFKQYKIEKELKRKEHEKRTKAATKIQAWWRGTMVRKGLGKYRKKKDKKAKKKGSGDKKK